MAAPSQTQVLIVGAGPTGLTLACELARRGVSFRLVDSAAASFGGSRGKGLQPRTLEVFDDLGIVERVLGAGALYPPFRAHLWRWSVRAGRLSKVRPPSPGVPYPNLWMLPQWRTEALLRERLGELGGRVEHGAGLTAFAQDPGGVTASVGGEEVRAELLVGCDGGHSFVRKALGARFEGESLPGRRVLIADVELEGLDRDDWHSWPLAKGCLLTLCPLPGTSSWQLAAPLPARAPDPELTEDGVRRFVAAAAAPEEVRVTRAGWISLYRPQVRMVDRYRVGRVLLAGDAAHVHPPAGGQGLNTGIQDAYNLGWKLAGVLGGAPDALLDSYEAERLPVAASVLGLSRRLTTKWSVRRGRETQQLGLSYRGGPLAEDGRPSSSRLRAGDRAPDAPCEDHDGRPRRLFDAFRGTHFTLLAFGSSWATARAASNPAVRLVRIAAGRAGAGPGELVDAGGHARAGYDVRADDEAVLVRPDGYVGWTGSSPDQLERYLARCAPGRSPRLADRSADPDRA